MAKRRPPRVVELHQNWTGRGVIALEVPPGSVENHRWLLCEGDYLPISKRKLQRIASEGATRKGDLNHLLHEIVRLHAKLDRIEDFIFQEVARGGA